MLELRLLGPLEVCRDGEPIALPGSASQRVLAALGLHAGDWLSAERLIDDVWGDRPPGSARKALQMHISRLRGALGDEANRIEHGPAGYRLSVPAEQIDTTHF